MKAVLQVGRLAPWNEGRQGERLDLELRLERVDGAGFATIDHEPITGGVVRLSVCGALIAGNGRDVGGGQNRGDLLELLDTGERFIHRERIVELHHIWARWHLNDMRAWCAHMPRRGKGLDVGYVAPCGYSYGEAWLVELLPRSVLVRVGDLFGVEVPGDLLELGGDV